MLLDYSPFVSSWTPFCWIFFMPLYILSFFSHSVSYQKQKPKQNKNSRSPILIGTNSSFTSKINIELRKSTVYSRLDSFFSWHVNFRIIWFLKGVEILQITSNFSFLEMRP